MSTIKAPTHSPQILPHVARNHQITPSNWIEIDSKQFQRNISVIHQHIGLSRKIGLVIKSNAYGHGLIAIASEAASIACIDYLLISSIEDAYTLRSHNIQKKIIIISALRDNLDVALQLDCSIMIADIATLQKLNGIATDLGMRARVHIKIDTGLSRFGFPPDEIPDLINALPYLSNIAIEGIYTHYAQSYHENQKFTLMQRAVFTTCIQMLQSAGYTIPLIHHANSAAALLQQEDDASLVRIGALAYGIWPSEYVQSNAQALNIRPIFSWKTKIIHLKKITAGSFVGYDMTYSAPRDMIIAIIPVGYYDGLDKRLSNVGSVKIGNQFAPIIGRISMNVATIDVSDIHDVQLDDTVTIIGSDQSISAQTIAHTTGSNNAREVLSKIHAHVVRRVVG